MKDKFSKWCLPLFWIFSFLVIIFMITFTSHAESSYFPMNQNDNNLIPQRVIDFIENNYNPENYNIVINGPYTVSIYTQYYFACWPKSDSYNCFGEINSNGYQWSLYKVGNFTVTYGHVQIKTAQLSSGNIQGPITGNESFYFSNRNSSLYDTGISFVSNYRIFTNNDPSTQSVVLKYGADPEPPVVNTGHATPPDPFEDPTLATGSNHTLPREIPESPVINYYSWTVYNSPNIDTTNLESLLESLIYVVNYLAGWLRDNLAGEFSNLLSNIQALIQFIVNTIQYYGGLIISTIQNGIDTFYNNMVSLFEPIADSFTYITAPIDSTIINTAFTSTNFYGIKTQFVNTFTTFDNAFDIAEPDSFTVVFNVQNITPLFDLGVRSPVTVDLGANFLPIRAALRTFLWILVTFGSVFVVEHGLSNWLRGARKE